MTLGDGILWSTVLILLAAGIYLLSVKGKWKTIGKVLAVLVLIGSVIGGGIWAYDWYEDRPYAETEFRGLSLGMRPVDVTLLKGAPTNENTTPEYREDLDEFTVMYIYNDEDTDSGPGKTAVFMRGATADDLRVMRVCALDGYAHLLRVSPSDSERDMIEALGEPSQTSISADGLSKWVNYEQWNAAYLLSAGEVVFRCLSETKMIMEEEYGVGLEPAH